MDDQSWFTCFDTNEHIVLSTRAYQATQFIVPNFNLKTAFYIKVHLCGVIYQMKLKIWNCT